MCLFGMGVDMLRGQIDDWWDKLPPCLHLYNDMYFMIMIITRCVFMVDVLIYIFPHVMRLLRCFNIKYADAIFAFFFCVHIISSYWIHMIQLPIFIRLDVMAQRQ